MLRQFNLFTEISDIKFRIYTDEDIKKISVLSITSEEAINNLEHFVPNGIYDLTLGPMSPKGEYKCKTCFNYYNFCSGHCGHINLPLPIFNPFFRDIITILLHRVCPSCSRFQAKPKRAVQYIYERKFLEAGYMSEALEVANYVSSFDSSPDQAFEVATNVEGEETLGLSDSQLANSEAAISSLETMLKKKLEDLKKDEEPNTTCHNNSIATTFYKKFLNDTKPKEKKSGCKSSRECLYCSGFLMKLKFDEGHLSQKCNAEINKKKDQGREQSDSEEGNISSTQPYVTAKQAQTLLRKCYAQDGYVIKYLYPFLKDCNIEHPTDVFFMDKLLVPAPRFRPANYTNGMLVENEFSHLYNLILRYIKCLRILAQQKDIKELSPDIAYILKEFKGTTLLEKSRDISHRIQIHVDNIYDSDLNHHNKIASRGIRQLIEKKKGQLRQNLMGKRVNFSARSVAAPDPMLSVDEVGVPYEFALKLTYPVPVTPWNVTLLRKLVQNGPQKYPGALMVQNEDGKRKVLNQNDEKQRNMIASTLLKPAESCVKTVNATKIVYRHMQNGDYVLINRQPTLHKPSIQAHKVKLMDDWVIRLPYASCKAYNADFDGDELNLHFPQHEMAKSEARYIATTRNNYLTLKDGTPLAGLIQDCVIAAVKLTLRGQFFNKEDYQQLVSVGINDQVAKIKILPPSILKPEKLWSGKQVISTLLHNIIPAHKTKPSLKFKTTVKPEFWQNMAPRDWNGAGGTPEAKKESMTESEFIMSNGELLCGVVDKSCVGSTSYGLVHLCYELYGGDVSTQVLSAVNRVCVFYLKWCGHSISLRDFITPYSASKRRRKYLRKSVENADSEVSKKLGLQPGELKSHLEKMHKTSSKKEMDEIDGCYASVVGPETSLITFKNEKKLYRQGLKNNMRMMVDAGAKGSMVNMNQISSLFGIAAIDGKRMPITISGKTLPSFKRYDTDPRSGGYIPTRFATGHEPRSFFFLCIVGRDSLQHTAVKTSKSGYLQRNLIKHLEGIKVNYDGTVRNSDGLVLQFNYGEDGMDVGKTQFLKNLNVVDSLFVNYSKLVDNAALTNAQKTKSEEVKTHKKYVKEYLKNNATKVRESAFTKFSTDMHSQNLSEFSKKHDAYTGRTQGALQMCSEWRRASLLTKLNYIEPLQDKKKGFTPTNSKFLNSSQLGVVTEALDNLIENYYKEKYSLKRAEEQTHSKKKVRDILHLKARESRVDPGEAVGAVCSQALGEPLTQMTLNTFHFAGRNELNVTLGVPRMEEILQTASEKIKTPIMEVPFKEGVSKEKAEKLKVQLTPVPLDKILCNVEIDTWNDTECGRHVTRHVVQFDFLPHREYKTEYFVRPSGVLKYMEDTFFEKLLRLIKAAIRKANLYLASTKAQKELPEEYDDDGASSRGDDLASDSGIGKSSLGSTKSENESSDDDLDENDDEFGSTARMRKRELADYGEEEDSKDEKEENFDDVMEEEFNEGLASQSSAKGRDRLNDLELSGDDSGFEGTNSSDNYEPKRKKARTTLTTPINLKTPVFQKSSKNKSGISDNEYACRCNAATSKHEWITQYEFDRNKQLWCKVYLTLPITEGRYDLSTMIKECANISFVYSVPGIKKAIVVDDPALTMKFEGVNIQKMYNFEHILDINHIYTNNIHIMLNSYGVEAAQRAIIKEIRSVQSDYNIEVDFRHLSLLADYFTCEGSYKACSRFALDTCSSPVQKMSYETCLSFMRNAVFQGEVENMQSPSASVLVGQPVRVGGQLLQIQAKLPF